VHPLHVGLGALAARYHGLVGNHHHAVAARSQQLDGLGCAGDQLELFGPRHVAGLLVDRAVAIEENSRPREAEIASGDGAVTQVGFHAAQPLGRAGVFHVLRATIAIQMHALCEQPRKDVFGEIERPGGPASPAQRPGLQNVKRRIHLIGKRGTFRMRVAVNGQDAAVFAGLHQVRVPRVVVGMQEERRFDAAGRVRGKEARQVHIHHGVAVKDEELLRQLVNCGNYRAGCPQRRRLVDATQTQPPARAIRAKLANGGGAEAAQQGRAFYAVARQQLELVFEQCFAANLNQRFGKAFAACSQPRTLAARQNYRIHN